MTKQSDVRDQHGYRGGDWHSFPREEIKSSGHSCASPKFISQVQDLALPHGWGSSFCKGTKFLHGVGNFTVLSGYSDTL